MGELVVRVFFIFFIFFLDYQSNLLDYPHNPFDPCQNVTERGAHSHVRLKSHGKGVHTSTLPLFLFSQGCWVILIISILFIEL